VTDFPSLDVQPGPHLVECFLGGRIIHGQIDLDASRPPTLAFIGDVGEIDLADGMPHGFPMEHQVSRIAGQLASGHDIIMVDNTVSTWFPGRSTVHGRYAIAGLEVAAVPGDRYKRIRLQITGADLLFGAAPLKTVLWPSAHPAGAEKRYSAVLNEKSEHRWHDKRVRMAIDCTYNLRFSLSNPYRYELAFAPVIEFIAGSPLTVDEWVSGWIMPLLGIAALATRRPQRLSWLTVHTGPRRMDTSGVVFGGNIDQAPYQAEYREEWREPDLWPIFTLATLPVGLPVLLRRWRGLEASENPFAQLYQLTLNQPDLPQRARFLYLIQALEALHGHENREKDARDQRAFAEQRQEILDEAGTLGFHPASLKFLKKNWGNRRLDSLDRRLADLLTWLPASVRHRVETSDMTTIATTLVDEGATTLPAQLRTLRNHLSHGTHNYADRDLQPARRVTEPAFGRC